MIHPIPDLTNLDYDAQHFRDVADTSLGRQLRKFLKMRDNLVRFETATFLRRPAVEPIAPGLLRKFGPPIAADRIKQTAGHMTRQIMESLGYTVDRQGLRIPNGKLFVSGTRYRA